MIELTYYQLHLSSILPIKTMDFSSLQDKQTTVPPPPPRKNFLISEILQQQQHSPTQHQPSTAANHFLFLAAAAQSAAAAASGRAAPPPPPEDEDELEDEDDEPEDLTTDVNKNSKGGGSSPQQAHQYNSSFPRYRICSLTENKTVDKIIVAVAEDNLDDYFLKFNFVDFVHQETSEGKDRFHRRPAPEPGKVF